MRKESLKFSEVFHPGDIKVSVVICTLNEAENLPHILPQIPAWVSEVLLVDGHSKDGTAEIAANLLPSIRILKQPGQGKGDAIKYGFEKAEGDIIIAIDADGSMNPAEMGKYAESLIQGSDLCKGSRFIEGGGTEDMPRHRIFGNWCFTALTNILYGTRFTDLAYGYFGCRREAWPKIKPESSGFTIETEISLKAKKSKLKITEVPSFEKMRISGKGNLRSFPDGSKILWMIIKQRFQ